MKLELDFTTGSTYIKKNYDIKMIIIDPNGTTFIADTSNNGKSMLKEWNLPQYSILDECKYHIDYFMILLNKYFKNKPKYKKYLQTKNNEEVFHIINDLLLDGYVVFVNITTYSNISLLLNGKQGQLFINYNTLTIQQQKSLEKAEKYLDNIDYIYANKYLDYEKNIKETYTITNNKITEILFPKPKTKIKTKPNIFPINQ